MSPTTTPDVRPLVAAQGQTREQVNAQALAIAGASAAAFTGWYSSEQIAEWSAALAKTLNPLLRLLAQNTDSYIARVVSEVAGKRFRPPGRIDVTALRSGVSRAGAYARAADAYRYQQSQFDQIARQIAAGDVREPPTMVTPVEAAVQRVRDVADMDTILTVQQQSQKTLVQAEDKGLVTGWRRVIHPELSISGSCGLCIAASDRVYKVGNLMPIHQRCNCIPVPILNRKDPGSILNDGDLARLYSDAGSTNAADLKRTRYVVNEHGELGPVLSGKKIRPDTQKRRRTFVPMTDAEQAVALQRIYDQLAAALPKTRELAYDSPAQWGKYADSLELRVAEIEKQLH